MLETIEEPLTRGTKVRFRRDGEVLSVRGVLDGWARDAAFADGYAEALRGIAASLGVDGIFWEHPPWTDAQLDEPAEAVILPGSGLERALDPESFGEHFARAASPAVVFGNLRGDSTLVAPVPEPGDAFGHLLAFLRTASPRQNRALWAAVGMEVRLQLGPEPLWLSTAGMGVSWLHIRLDRRPKYYQHRPYRRRPG